MRRNAPPQRHPEPEQRDEGADAERPQNARVAAAAGPARVALVALHWLLFVLSHGRLGARQNRLVVLFFV